MRIMAKKKKNKYKYSHGGSHYNPYDKANMPAVDVTPGMEYLRDAGSSDFVLNPEFVTPDNPMGLATGAITSMDELVGSFMPGTSEAIDATYMKNALQKGNYGEASLYGAGMMLPFVTGKMIKGLKSFFTPSKKFKSDIDWGKWNKEIPDNKDLLKEYHAIEEMAKKEGNWMKNADGSSFKGTPEQFVQQQSKNFKKAFPEGFHSTYRGLDEKWGNTPNLINPAFKDKYTGVFTGEKHIAEGYGVPYNVASKKSSNALTVNVLQSPWENIKIPSSKTQVEKGLELAKKSKEWALKKPIKGMNYTDDFFKRVDANIESYENLLKNWDKTINNPNYKALLEYKNTGTFPQGFATDDVAKFMEDLGLDNLHLKNIVDGGDVGNVLIHNQLPGNYLKSLEGNTGMFDMTNPDIYKKDGGRVMKYNIGGVAKNNADAEIEGGEIILTQQGAPKLDNMSGLTELAPNAYEVTGKSHEEGGVFAKFKQGENIIISNEYAKEMKTALALLNGDKIEQNQAQIDIKRIINTQQSNNGNNTNVTMARYGMKKYDNGGRDFTSPVDKTYVASPILDEDYVQQMLDDQPGMEAPFNADKILNPLSGTYLYETRNRPSFPQDTIPTSSRPNEGTYRFLLDTYRDEINRLETNFAETPMRNAEYIENVAPGSAGGTQIERQAERDWNNFLRSYMMTGLDTLDEMQALPKEIAKEMAPNQRYGGRNISYQRGGRYMPNMKKGGRVSAGQPPKYVAGGILGALGAVAPFASGIYNILAPMLAGPPDTYNPQDFYATPSTVSGRVTDRVSAIPQSAKMTTPSQMDPYAITAPMQQLSATAMNNYSGPSAASYRQALLSDMAPKIGSQFAQIDYQNQLAKERLAHYNLGIDKANIGVDMANIDVDKFNLGLDQFNAGITSQANMQNQQMNWNVNQYNDQLLAAGPAQTATGFGQLSNAFMGQQYNQTLQGLSDTLNYSMGQGRPNPSTWKFDPMTVQPV